MTEKRPAGTDAIELHPERESWARITTHNSLVGLAILLGAFALVVILRTLDLGPSSFAAAGAIGAGIVLGLFLRGKLKRRGGLLANIELTARIKADLITELDAHCVNVDSSNSVVTLRGRVPYDDFRKAAEEIARRQGATRVVDELKVDASAPGKSASFYGLTGVTTPVGAPETATHAPLEETVRKALDADPRVNANLLFVKVEDGIAYMTGRQDIVQAGEAATEVAAHVPGILGVSNDIEIESSV
jgi:osmotically-inducible protein OsmY